MLPSKPTSPTPTAKDNAAHLRKNTTPPEGVLWSKIRNRQLGGLKFRRQHPIGPFVADFYCAEAKLVVEMDSSYHAGRQEQDAARDSWMNAESIEVLRVNASQLAKNEEGVLALILRTTQARVNVKERERPSPQPSPTSGRGRKNTEIDNGVCD